MSMYKKHKNLKPGQRPKCSTDTGPGRAKQEFREESDINFIMKRYGATGQLPVNMQSLQPVFADVSEVGDYASALRRVNAAELAFDALPADLRFKFGNRPESLVSFLEDDRNRLEAEKLGLVAKKEAPPPPPTPKA